MNRENWKKYGLEFLSIFIAVISAFALNNWQENRRDHQTENKILVEIAHGLEKDIEDVRINKGGHEDGIKACQFWRNLINKQTTKTDSVAQHYLNLTRDFISIQNVSGYETLKSRGLEFLRNDSLRFAIISLYEYDYNTLKKFEENYYEMQFQANYFKPINDLIAPYFRFDERGNITNIDLPLSLSSAEQKQLLSYLWKIQLNRNFILYAYKDVEKKIVDLREKIEQEL